MKNLSAKILISTYTLAPLVTTKVMAQDYKPYGGCDPSTTDCTIQAPSFDLFHPMDSLIYYLIYWFLLFIDGMSDFGTEIFSKNTTNIPGVGSVASGWKYEAIGTFVDFFGELAIFMLALGTFIAVAEMAIAYSNGQGNMAGSFVNIIKATVFALLYTNVMVYIFTEVIAFGREIINGAGLGTPGTSSIGSTALQWLGAAGLVGGGIAGVVMLTIPVLAVVLAFLLVAVFKFDLVLAKRSVVFMALLAEGTLLPFSMARGYAGNFQSFLQKSMTFMLSCMLQVWFFCLGFYFLGMAPSTEYWFEMFILGWAFIECADKVFGYMGTVGGGGENPIASGFKGAMGAVRTATMLCAHNDVHGLANSNKGGTTASITGETGDNNA